MILSDLDHQLRKFKILFVFFSPRPVQPGDRVVLAVGVVVTRLCIAKFIPGIKHGGPAADHQRRESIAAHAFP